MGDETLRRNFRSVLSQDSRASQPYVFGIVKGAPSVSGKYSNNEKSDSIDSFDIRSCSYLNPKAGTLGQAL